ncbi:RNA polymerase I subunit RpI1 isoform X2 [Rhodnius prolixus]|uniref:RNA polymerase I subunit RpI1 isoform X2 n=1 Tax=Rhodnius prolixus TaxID=13249 RepID=UPI003D18E10D
MEFSKLDFMRISVPTGLTFSTFSASEIKQLSVAKIVTPLTFNVLGHPLPGGLYDPALGPLDNKSICQTCSLNFVKCPGHLGHIELPLPVINPLYHKSVGNLLKISCLNCHKILIPNNVKSILLGQLKLLNAGLVAEAQELENKFGSYNTGDKSQVLLDEVMLSSAIDHYVKQCIEENSQTVRECKGEDEYRSLYIKNAISQIIKKKTCPFCNNPWKSINVTRNKILISYHKLNVVNKNSSEKRKSEKASSGYSYLLPLECKKHLEQIWYGDSNFVGNMVPLVAHTAEPNPVDAFFMTVIPVSPTNARPVNYVDGRVMEHPQNSVYKAILNDCLVLRSIMQIMNKDDEDNLSEERRQVVEGIKGATDNEKLHFAWRELQIDVDSLLDIDLKKSRKVQGIGIKQIIEKKEGIIRMNMMGKRVNFAARTVITPDPNLNVDEVGVPEVFAMKLTFPVPVTMWNVADLRNLVKNGPNIYPGANFVENEDGSVVKLNGKEKSQRAAVAKRLLTPGDCKGVKIVHRHMINGDVVLLNRQPTLHKPSIMAHRVRILKGEKTFRLHYANCKSYNADFDGDEMNAHFPQNEVARSEGYNIASVSRQYLVPKDGTPLSGLIQDYMVSGVRLTMRGRFFTRNEYMHLVFQGLSFMPGDITTLPPAIMKPSRLWSGKQVISTVLKNIVPKGKTAINLTSISKIPASAWEKKSRNWKAGGTPFTDAKTMTEAEVVIRNGDLLCGVLDKTHFGAVPYSLVHCVYELYGGEIATRLLSCLGKLFTAFLQMEGFTLGLEDILVLREADQVRKEIIQEIRQVGNDIAKEAVDVPDGTSIRQAIGSAHSKDPLFRALLDHQYKRALSSYTNNINKVCLPAGLLSPFPKNNLQLMVLSGAKGSTVNTLQISCLLGQIELEGKRPPAMVSGRTLPSFPPYDTSPRAGGFIDGRFMTGIKPQEFFFHCMAGREGLVDTAVKTSRSGYLQRCLVKHLEGLTVNYDMTVRDSDGSVVQFLYGEDGMEVTKSQFLNEKQLPFLAENINSLHNPEEIESLRANTDLEGVKAHGKLVKRWNRHRIIGPKQWCSPFSLFSIQVEGSGSYEKPSSTTGRTKSAESAVKVWRNMDTEERNRFHKILRRTPDPVVSKYQCDRYFGSVTEKLDKLIDNYLKQNSEKKMNRLRRHFTRITLADVLRYVTVTYRQDFKREKKWIYVLKFEFLPHSAYKDTTLVSPKKILKHIESKFIRHLINHLKQKSEKTSELIETEAEGKSGENCLDDEEDGSPDDEKLKRKKNVGAEFDEYQSSEDEVENEDDDATTARRRARQNEEHQYSDLEDDVEAQEDLEANQLPIKKEDQEPQDEEMIDFPEKLNENASTRKTEDERRTSVINSHLNVMDYKYDTVKHDWCELWLAFKTRSDELDVSAAKLKEAASTSVIHQIAGIKRAFISTDTNGQQCLTTDGQNITEILNHGRKLNLYKLYTNDIHSVHRTFGIEAACSVLVKEIQQVFNVYGIAIDIRHLNLVADYMTWSGQYKPLSRKGLEGSTSPLQQMSFESSIGFLKSAVTRHKYESLNSPSARLMIGRPIKAGTSCFNLLYKIDNEVN